MSPDEVCRLLATENQGVFTRAEAVDAGVSPRQLRHRVLTGVLDEMLPGVYRIAGPPITWDQRVIGAQKWAGPVSAAAGPCAAAVWELEGWPRDAIEIVTTRRMRGPGGDMRFRETALSASDLRTVDGIVVTCPELTLLDVAGSCSLRKLESTIDEVLGRRLTTSARLEAFLERKGGCGRSGTKAMKKALGELKADSGASHFERRLFRVLSAHGLPRPVPQYKVKVGRQTFYLDFAYPAERLGIEAHSYRHHSERGDWEKDQARHNALTNQGWRLMYVTWRRLRDHPAEVVREIGNSLSLRANDG